MLLIRAVFLHLPILALVILSTKNAILVAFHTHTADHAD